MRELGSRYNEIDNALKTGLSKSILRFYDRVVDAPSRDPSVLPCHSSQRPSASQDQTNVASW